MLLSFVLLLELVSMTVISFSRRNDHDYLVGWWVELAWDGVFRPFLWK
jgi:hypothetical protein